MSETKIQNDLRAMVGALGGVLWRNNNGAYFDRRGIQVRYGLANDSKKVNKITKSSDLIGIMPVVITEDMIGETLGQFVAIECKKPGWKRGENETRESAQENFHEIVKKHGGLAFFASTLGDALLLLNPKKGERT